MHKRTYKLPPTPTEKKSPSRNTQQQHYHCALSLLPRPRGGLWEEGGEQGEREGLHFSLVSNFHLFRPSVI